MIIICDANIYFHNDAYHIDQRDALKATSYVTSIWIPPNTADSQKLLIQLTQSFIIRYYNYPSPCFIISFQA